MPVSDAALGQVVRRHFQGHAVAGKHSDAIAPQLSGQEGQNSAILIELNAKQSARKLLNNGTTDFDTIFFAHSPL